MRPGIVRWLSGLLASVLMVAAVAACSSWSSRTFRHFICWCSTYRWSWWLPSCGVPGWRRSVRSSALRSSITCSLTPRLVGGCGLAERRRAGRLPGHGGGRGRAGGPAAARGAGIGSAVAGAGRAAAGGATLIARGAPPAAIFTAVAKEVGQLFAAEFSAVVRYDPDGTSTAAGSWSRIGGTGACDPVTAALGGRSATTMVFETGRPARIERVDRYADDDSRAGTPVAGSRGPRSTVGAPISVEGRVWGALQVASPREAGLPVGTEERVADFAELVATAIANADAKAQLQESRARIATSADETRRRIERDLHDGAQRLVSLALQLRAAQAAVPPELGEISAELDRVTTGLTDALDELREYARGIHPALLTDHGLGPALRTLARRCPLPVDLDMRTNGRLPEPVEVCAYYLIAEALTNAAKHANASRIAVGVEAVTGVLRLSVRDDGTGCADFTATTGLIGLKDRVEALGGRISLNSPPGAGTTLQVEFPLTDADRVTSS